MEQTFNLRNGKTLNRKTISYDGTLLSESNLKPLFGIYDKARSFLGDTLKDYLNTHQRYSENVVVKDVIYSEV